jgi:FtsH-binding integral membrane protein
MSSEYSVSDYAQREHNLIRNTFIWMAGALAVSGLVALFLFRDPALLFSLIQNRTFLFIFLVKIGLVFYLSSRIMKMSVQAAVISFIVYSALTGVTLSTILFYYTAESVTSTFFITAGTFAVMAFYGMTTKKDLSSWGNFLFMGIIGILIASVVNWFLGSALLSYIVSGIGVLIFTGLTAYDVQWIKKLQYATRDQLSEDDYMRYSIIGALKLYLDFINLFLFMLRFLGRRR